MRIPVGTGAPGHLVPDGLFGLEYCGGAKSAYRFFAVECDRGTMPVRRSGPGQTSYLGKLVTYREIIQSNRHRAHLGVPNLLVLSVMTCESRRKAVAAVPSGAGGIEPALLFKVVGDLIRPEAQLLEEPWERTVSPPLTLTDRSG